MRNIAQKRTADAIPFLKYVLAGTVAVTLLATSGCGPATTASVKAAANTGAIPHTDENATGPTPDSPTPSPGGAGPNGLAVKSNDEVGNFLTDALGNSVYVFDKDTANPPKSNCNGDCAQTWRPVPQVDTTKQWPGVTGPVGSVTRDDNTQQVTIAGHPLYTYVMDTAPGDTKGNGASNGLWALAAPDGTKAAKRQAGANGQGQGGQGGKGQGTAGNGQGQGQGQGQGGQGGKGQGTAGNGQGQGGQGGKGQGGNGQGTAGNGQGGKEPGPQGGADTNLTVVVVPAIGDVLSLNRRVIYLNGDGILLGDRRRCRDACLSQWRPVRRADLRDFDRSLGLQIGEVVTETGLVQLTINGERAFWFGGDTEILDVRGRGDHDCWWPFSSAGLSTRVVVRGN
ncbi:hypothetical protein ACFVSN_43300 [Kitasatospora sp. NPDC057904]|uniref:hypothetical protein n=1 Tax=unclassified Kitasatospora TaxID=2633591 RepID=UPI0036D871CD